MTDDGFRYDGSGLLTAIAQDAHTGEVLMVAHMDREALRRTIGSGQAWYWSRSRGRLWRKGETSGHTQRVTAMRADCDGDAVLLSVEQAGPACHTGHRSCFFRQVDAGGDGNPALAPAAAPEGSAGARTGPAAPSPQGDPRVLEEVGAVLADRRRQPRDGSYVSALFAGGLARLNEKLMEEAAEVSRAARKESAQRLVEETADLWFHSLALLAFAGVSPDAVWTELAARRR